MEHRGTCCTFIAGLGRSGAGRFILASYAGSIGTARILEHASAGFGFVTKDGVGPKSGGPGRRCADCAGSGLNSFEKGADGGSGVRRNVRLKPDATFCELDDTFCEPDAAYCGATHGVEP